MSSIAEAVPFQESRGVVYEWRGGTRLEAELAPKIGEWIMSLHRRGVALTAENVLEKARLNKRSPLNKVLEWDNTKAAHEYRLEQVRYVLRSLRYEMPNGNPMPKVRSFVHITTSSDQDDRKSQYFPIHVVMSDDELRYRMIDQAKAELERFKTKYAELLTYKDFRDELRKLLEL